MLAASSPPSGVPVRAAPRNVIIFVADGLRSHSVTPQTAPALAAVRAQGVDFRNSHSLFPTVTTANGSAIATGHLLGDTGDFGNTIYQGAPMPSLGSALGYFENDRTLALMNQRFDGNYLGETSLLQAARAKGYATAALGKEGPTGVQDVTARDGKGAIVIDSATSAAGRAASCWRRKSPRKDLRRRGSRRAAAPWARVQQRGLQDAGDPEGQRRAAGLVCRRRHQGPDPQVQSAGQAPFVMVFRSLTRTAASTPTATA